MLLPSMEASSHLSAPKAVLFDVNETLISLQPLAQAMVDVGLRADQLEVTAPIQGSSGRAPLC